MDRWDSIVVPDLDLIVGAPLVVKVDSAKTTIEGGST